MNRVMVFCMLILLLAGCLPTNPGLPGTETPIMGQATATLIPIVTSTTMIETTQALASTPAPFVDIPLNKVGQLEGSIYGITVLGDVAFVGRAQQVAAIDIRQHENPTTIGQSEALPGIVSQVLPLPDEPTLLVVNAGKYLVMIDIADPQKIKANQQVALPGEITSMVLDSELYILYVAGALDESQDQNIGFLTAIDLTHLHRLQTLSSVSMPEVPISLALVKKGLYAGAEGYQGGLYFARLVVPGTLSTPQQIIESTMHSPFQPRCLQVFAERLYVSYRSLEAYDISEPENPRQAWKISVNSNVVQGFEFFGEKVYLFGWTILSTPMHTATTLPEVVAGGPPGLIASYTAFHQGDFLIAYDGLEFYQIIE